MADPVVIDASVFTVQLAYDGARGWVLGEDLTPYLANNEFLSAFNRYIALRTVELFQAQATVGRGGAAQTSNVVVNWPSGFGALASYLLSNPAQFAVMAAFLAGERNGVLQRLAVRGIDVVVDRQMIPPTSVG